MPIVIMQCTCKHVFQDKQYGNGKRVFNTMKDDTRKARCTVCKSEKSLNNV